MDRSKPQSAEGKVVGSHVSAEFNWRPSADAVAGWRFSPHGLSEYGYTCGGSRQREAVGRTGRPETGNRGLAQLRHGSGRDWAIWSCRRLSYVRSPRGIQWMLERLRDPKKAGAAFLGPDVLVSFKELMCRWLVDCPPFQRLAFGAALYLPVKDRREGYRELKNRLKFGPEHEEKEGDFLYQYNRRRTSLTVPELEINRLSKWTWVPLGEVYVKDGKLIHPPESACLLELDINTMPEFQGTLPHDRCAPLFEEMVKLAVEIAQRGDVP